VGQSSRSVRRFVSLALIVGGTLQAKDFSGLLLPTTGYLLIFIRRGHQVSKQEQYKEEILKCALSPEIEKLRDSRRERSRIAYDCFNLRERKDRAYCVKGYCLGTEDGSYDLLSILRGVTPSICKKCPDFDDVEVEGDSPR